MSVQRLARPLIKMAASFVTSAGFDPAGALDSAEKMRRYVEGEGSLVDRTVTAKTFSGMLRETEALQSLIKFHFSPVEIAAIERSLRKG